MGCLVLIHDSLKIKGSHISTVITDLVCLFLTPSPLPVPSLCPDSALFLSVERGNVRMPKMVAPEVKVPQHAVGGTVGSTICLAGLWHSYLWCISACCELPLQAHRRSKSHVLLRYANSTCRGCMSILGLPLVFSYPASPPHAESYAGDMLWFKGELCNVVD